MGSGELGVVVADALEVGVGDSLVVGEDGGSGDLMAAGLGQKWTGISSACLQAVVVVAPMSSHHGSQWVSKQAVGVASDEGRTCSSRGRSSSRK